MPRPIVFDGSATYPSPSPNPVLTIGNFDGVHRGHQALLERVTARARELGRPSCAFTFDPAPVEVLRPDLRGPRIQTIDERVASLGRGGIDHVVIERFDREYARRDAAWFAAEVVMRRLGAVAVIVGWDFRFGRDRSGDVVALASLLPVPVEKFGPFKVGDDVPSSSRIRSLVLEGAVDVAQRLLGRPHRVLGAVVRGDGRARGLGFPTANLAPITELLPAKGVYAVSVTLPDGTTHPGVANIGMRPTFEAGFAVEVHLLDWSGDLYGQVIAMDLIARLRGEHKFASVGELVDQIRVDAADARRALESSAGTTPCR